MQTILYCKMCMATAPSGTERCPQCGYKKIKEIKDNDAVYLTGKNFVLSGILEDVLTKNGIPYLKKGATRIAIMGQIDNGTARAAFFVPFGCYKKAVELLIECFGEL